MPGRSRRDPRRRSAHRSRGRRPQLQPLEDRTLLSAFYDLSTVASTAGGQFTSFGNLVSMNDSGTVAFVGNNGTESGLWVNDPAKGLINVNPTYTNDQPIPRSFGRAVAINDNGELIATDRVVPSGTSGLYYTRLWSEANPDFHVDLYAAPGGLGDFSSLQTFTDINNNGDAAFVGLSSYGGFRSVEFAPASNLPGVSDTVDEVPTSGPTPGGGEGPIPSPEPQITDDGRVLVFESELDTLTLRTSLTSAVVIASPAQGFKWIGQAPGVSADGRVVVFTGDRGKGPGLFASYVSGGSSRTIIRLAGEGLDGFTDFNPLDAVRINNTESTERGSTVVFMATSNLGTGIYTTRISFFGDSASDFDPDDPNVVSVSGATPVALVGDVVHPANGTNGTVTISSLNLWDGINDANRGEIAFWAQLSDQSQEILKAEPRPVVWIDFNPQDSPPPGETGTNLAILQQVGITDLGWSGDFQQSLEALGFTTDFGAFESQIVAAVQSYFTAAGSNVRVLGAPGDQEPAYIPYTVTDSHGTPLRDANGDEITRGVYQTVYVGGGPDNGGTDLGMASPPYQFAGSIDFFHQIPDATAVVFSDRIFDPINTGAPIGSLSQAVRVEAVATVIAHEAGHNFGLFHLDPTQTQWIMSGGFQEGEFNNPRQFNLAPVAVKEYAPSLAGVTESSDKRLAFGTGSTLFTAAPPDPALLALDTPSARAQIGAGLNGSPVAVKDLIVGVTSGDVDSLPRFVDLGGGDLATLLANASILTTSLDGLMILGSTTGTSMDIVVAPDAATAGSLADSALGLATDSRLVLPLAAGSVSSPWHVYQISSNGPEDLGTIRASNVSLIPPLVVTPVPDQIVTETSSIEVDLNVTPPEPQGGEYLYALAPGAPPGTSIGLTNGVVVYTPLVNTPAGTYPVTVDVQDVPSSYAPPARSTSITFNIVVQQTLDEPPQLNPIGDREAQVGDLVTFTATATDPNVSQSDLTYSLDPGAPAGAAIDPTTGQFSWLACCVEPGSYPVTVRVTDNGSPALSDTQTVTITVIPQAQQRPGDPILGFGTSGVVQTGLTLNGGVDSAEYPVFILVQPNGDIILGGVSEQEPVLARFLPDGTLDPAFGVRGRMTYDFRTVVPSLNTVFTQVGAVLLSNGQIEMVCNADQLVLPSPAPGAIPLGEISTISSIALVRLDADGTLDPTFGTGGVVLTELGGLGTTSEATGIALQPDGDIVVTGSYQSYAAVVSVPAVLRYLPDGTLDPTFGDGGSVIYSTSNVIKDLTAVAIQSDGRIVLAGDARFPETLGPLTEVAVTRLNPDGSLDTTFGSSGTVFYTSANQTNVVYDSAANVVLQPDGKIVVLDSASVNYELQGKVLRLNADGSFDASFGTSGVASLPFGDNPDGFAIGPGGVIACGLRDFQILPAEIVELNPDGSPLTSFGSGGTAELTFAGPLQQAQFPQQIEPSGVAALAFQPDGELLASGGSSGATGVALARLNSDGSFDPAFGAVGRSLTQFLVTAPIGGPPLVVAGPDGTLLVDYNFADGILCYNADGSPDTSFGDDGVLHPQLDLQRTSIDDFAVLPDGKILIAGNIYPNGVYNMDNNPPAAVARLLPDGNLDPTFGTGGIVAFPPRNLPGNSAEQIVIQSDGKILVSLSSGGQVARLNPDGTLDETFGTDGIATIAGDSGGTLLAVLPGGQISAAFGRMVARLNPDGSLDTSFGTDGQIAALAIQPDGKILLSFASQTGLAVARYNADGSPDTSFGSDGIASVSPGVESSTSSFALAGDGSILVAGIAYTSSAGNPPFALAVACFNSSGALETTFGTNGVAMQTYDPTVPTSGGMGIVSNIIVSPDSRSFYIGGSTVDNHLVIAGYSLYPPLPAPGALEFQTTQAAVAESAGVATVMVGRTGGSAGTVTVNYATSDGTAKAGSEYTAASGTLTFAPGQTSASFTVPIIDNPLAGNTTVNLTLSDPTGGATIAGDGTSVLTIQDTDLSATGAGVLQFDSPTFTASEADESAVVVVDRVDGSSGTVTVPYSVVDRTAVAGQDYEATSGVLSFGPGVTELAFTIPLLHDAAVAANTTAGLELGTPTGGAALGIQDTASLTILDIDATSQIQPAVAQVPVAANQGSVSVKVTRSAGLGKSVAIAYSTADGTALAGRDYTPVSGTLVFPAGVTSGTITIPITPDLSLSQAVSFQVDLSAPTGGAGVAATSAETVTIEPPPPLPPTSSYPALPPLALLGTSPANGATLSSRPGQLVLTFSQYLANLVDGGPAIDSSDPTALTWSDAGTSTPITTVYHADADGTSTIIITPNYPSYALPWGAQTIQIDLNAFSDEAGLHVTDPNGGVVRFTVTEPSGGNGGLEINPIPARIVAPGTPVSVLVTALNPPAGETLQYRLSPGAPAGAAIDPNSGLFTWVPGPTQEGSTFEIGVTVTAVGPTSLSGTTQITVTVLAAPHRFPPEVTSVSTIPLRKRKVNEGTIEIDVSYSEAMSSSAGAASLYSIAMTSKVRKHGRVTTKLVPLAFSSRLIATNRVSLTLAKPSKKPLTLIVRGAVAGADGLTLGQDETFRL